MKSIADAVAKSMRHRQWHWCRRPNGFSDLPKWRMVAERLQLPLYQVVAFVNRLEEFANDAGNKGYSRGEIGHFSAEEFGLALGMPEADAARIFAALEEPAVGWVAYGHVADFYDRNRDKEDDTATLRKRRERARDDVLKKLAQLARIGGIEPGRRTEIEASLMLLDDSDLFLLKAEIAGAVLSTARGVTRDGRRDGRRDIVTVTPEERRDFKAQPVDNFGDSGRGAASGPSDDSTGGNAGDPHETARLWLAGEGKRVVVERMEEEPGKAETRIERWLEQQLDGDAIALGEIIRGADTADYMGARFHNLIVDGIRRRRQQAQGPELPLMPPRPKGRAHG